MLTRYLGCLFAQRGSSPLWQMSNCSRALCGGGGLFDIPVRRGALP
jgi:hypothetical protein